MKDMQSGANGKIGAGQLGKLLYLFSLGSAALIVPTAVVQIARQDSWLSMLLVIPLHYFIILIYLALANRFPHLSLAQYSQHILGTWLGKIVTATYIFYFSVLCALVLRNMSDFIGKSVLPQTPEWFLSGTFMLVIVYGTYLGIETIGRTGDILFGWTLIVIFIISVALFNQMYGGHFLPLLGEGIVQAMKGMYPVLGFPVAECVFLTVLLPLVQTKERSKLYAKLAVAVAVNGGISTLNVAMLIAVLGVSETVRSPYAVYEMVKAINIEDILVRVEILFAVVWIGTVFMKLLLSFYTVTVLLGQFLHLRTYRPLVVPLGLFIVPMSIIIYRNSVHSTIFAMDVWTIYSVGQGVMIPLVLLLIAWARGARSEEKGAFPSEAANRTRS
ncbi:endospore germination permease [Paenibacillus sp. J5C_2022]|uniref:GerAB/ArcD/ProY family transporter n=1 Tax=Paenibacillus sp. J5C2022 TaxID=2977129 RepID=UPI0021CFAD3F|nr:endospore germination permease [Paenibacillus sp. J5C2022]MCU6708498.1 endospore germination permease [Paenibacillus sp. J5C2022]